MRTQFSVSFRTMMIASLCGLLFGCSSGTGNGNTAAGSGSAPSATPASPAAAADNAAKPAADSKPLTITFWHDKTGVAGDAVNQVVKDFEKKYPNIKVNSVYVAQTKDERLSQKLLISIASKTPPDAAYFDRFLVGSYAGEDALTDLTERAKKDNITAGDYYPFAWDEAHYKDKLYALPLDTDARMIFYNKDLFKSVGLDPENPPKTIAELDAAAEKLTVMKGNKIERMGFIPWYSQGVLYSWGWSFGGQFYDEKTGKVTANDPKIVEALTWMNKYADKYGIENVNGFVDSTGADALDPFITGQIAMVAGTNSNISKYTKFKPDLKYGVFPFPNPAGDKFTTWSGGHAMIIPKWAKNEDAAWEFIKYFTGPEGQLTFNKGIAGLAVTPKLNDTLGYKTDPVLSKFMDLLPVAHFRPVLPIGAVMWDQLLKAPDQVARKAGTPQAILDKITNDLNAELAKKQAAK
ncbi:ABC transporter substrate-binding protein [Paenibacillus thalictri]|uniref:ABC transporter substrate-binding protein n=1 Tax=Paenibacillus thalictri TaxID=2527873 RepID=A0A4Q9DVI5_9BACL|nr:ABC transporter substrate-binding protein [Paenibacillus thalictri]TBL81057.1 ABC transporter substrate-binding protein [Paenibacillus thalictri]